MNKPNTRIRTDVRNIAIVAHVDHGKTTLVDRLLQFTGTIAAGGERVMDSNDLERERGITILAKQTGIEYGNHFINIVDTPGHSDFGGEVERTLQMVEGFLLLVDAAEGVLPGTRFVLQKALALNLKPIVLINKVDRPDADISRTENMIHDLFLDLATNSDQLGFTTLYGSSRLGFVTTDPSVKTGTVQPLLDAIIKDIPAPVEQADGLQLLTTNLDYSNYLGQIAIGRVFSGTIKVGQPVACCRDNSICKPQKITKLYKFRGLERVEVTEASFGDIVAVAGFDEPVVIGMTLCDIGNPLPHAYVSVDEPTLSMYFCVNNSPFAGREGNLLTSRQIRDRLYKELKLNVALRVEDTDSADMFKVSGRGQLHLGILIENMRREGFELQVSAPEVIYKEIDGKKCEPIEHLVVDVQSEHQGVVMELLGKKKAELTHMTAYDNGRVRMEFLVPSRGLIGFRSQFLTDTRGSGIATFSFHGYFPYKGDIVVRTKGALVSMENGSATGYALNMLQERGTLFIVPGDKIYEGLIVGEHSRETDLDINPCKPKKLSNMRTTGTDEAVNIEPPRIMSLEICMEWIRPDELIEITPESIRLRKKILRAALR
ncbi:MAG: GTP-binding protein TypA [candidate division TM6 bacterium GW2011_GWE2_41_16]|nr:MAG: GTP-binding protein TypA [candidate division TM6 bacterium GW2011_GWE2_41_16]